MQGEEGLEGVGIFLTPRNYLRKLLQPAAYLQDSQYVST